MKLMMVRRSASILSILVLLASYAFIDANVLSADLGENVTFKISLENHLEKRIKDTLTEITGTDRVVVIVNATISPIKEKAGRRKGKLTQKKKKDVLVLPGVPMKKEIGTAQSQNTELLLPFVSQSNFMVKKINAVIWLDKNISESMLDLVDSVAKKVVGYDQGRGDQIEIKLMDFERRKFYFLSLFYPPNLYWLILSLMGGFFLVTFALFLINPFKKLSSAVKDIDWDLIRGKNSGGGSLQGEYFGSHNIVEEKTVNKTKEREDSQTLLPFSFIKERDLPNLAFLLSERSIQDIATVMNYLDTDLAVRLLELYPEEQQVKIASCLGSEELNQEKVNNLETTIKENLNYVIGGEKKIASILRMVGDRVREKVLEEMKKTDESVATRLDKKVKSFESMIQGLSRQDIQILYRQFDPTLFAQIMKGSSEDIRKRVLESLSEGAAERLQQEIDLSPPLSLKRLRNEKLRVILTVSRLIEDGIIEEVED